MDPAHLPSPAASQPTLAPLSAQPSKHTLRAQASKATISHSIAPSGPLSETSTIASVEQVHRDDDSVISQFERETYGPEPGEKGWDKYEVSFAADDPERPQNWSRAQRWYITLFSGLLVLNAYVVPIADIDLLTDKVCPARSRVQRHQVSYRK